MKIKLILAIQAILLIIGIVMGGGKDITILTKIIISALFLVTALYFYVLNKTVYNKFIALAMIFCLFGDMATSGLLPGHLMTGMALFGMGHICFILGYFKTVKIKSEKFPKKIFAISGCIYYVIFIFIWIIFVIPTGNGTAFLLAALGYGIIASTMATIAVSLSKVNREYLQTAIGASLFWISDTMIAINLTNSYERLPVAIITTYFAALALIIYTGQKKIYLEELIN